MQEHLDLINETLSHFQEGAKSVRAYSDEMTYIITKVKDSDDYWVALEEPGFPKQRASSLEQFFDEVFGIEARY
ncbi:hypothetical protein [Chryseosolibacter indicus]|uniref:Retrotransposon gag domain-containing protein n=1 Tax=Chryseosolibacter indicus TaxID=2782351 RepID=A0ABS5VRB4_9BACT|nr:hypothetical protein [Chryseosolibacter indicus]MBT1703993.1 hypothetical protein [Chryseosolibacter indicus]